MSVSPFNKQIARLSDCRHGHFAADNCRAFESAYRAGIFVIDRQSRGAFLPPCGVDRVRVKSGEDEVKTALLADLDVVRVVPTEECAAGIVRRGHLIAYRVKIRSADVDGAAVGCAGGAAEGYAERVIVTCDVKENFPAVRRIVGYRYRLRRGRRGIIPFRAIRNVDVIIGRYPEGVFTLRRQIRLDALSRTYRVERPRAVEIQPERRKSCAVVQRPHVLVYRHRFGHLDVKVESACGNAAVRIIGVLLVRIPSEKLERSVVNNAIRHNAVRPVNDVAYFVDLRKRIVGVCHYGHGPTEGNRVAVRGLVILFGQPYGFQCVEINVAVDASARAEQLRGVEPRYVRKIILFVVVRHRKLPAYEVIPFFGGHGKLLILRIGLDGQFRIKRAAVEVGGDRLGLVCLIKIPISRDTRAVVEIRPFSPADVLIPIHALVKLEIFQLIHFSIRGESPVLHHIHGVIRLFGIDVAVQIHRIIAQHIEVHKIGRNGLLVCIDSQKLEIAAVIQCKSLRAVGD